MKMSWQASDLMECLVTDIALVGLLAGVGQPGVWSRPISTHQPRPGIQGFLLVDPILRPPIGKADWTVKRKKQILWYFITSARFFC